MARRLGRIRATVIAVRVSRALSGVMLLWAVLGIWPLYRPSFLLAALAGVLWLMAGAELQAATFWSYFGQREEGTPDGSPGSSGEVEVLDAEGRPAVQAEQPLPSPGFTVEEHHAPGVQRWVVRGPDGKILFVSETPLKW